MLLRCHPTSAPNLQPKLIITTMGTMMRMPRSHLVHRRATAPRVGVNTLLPATMRVQTCHRQVEVTLNTTKAVLCTRTTVVGQRTTEGTMLQLETYLVKSFSLGTNSMATTSTSSSSHTLAMRPQNIQQVSILGILATHKVSSQPRRLQGTKTTRSSIRVVATILMRVTLATRKTQTYNAGNRRRSDRGSVAQSARSLTGRS